MLAEEFSRNALLMASVVIVTGALAGRMGTGLRCTISASEGEQRGRMPASASQRAITSHGQRTTTAPIREKTPKRSAAGSVDFVRHATAILLIAIRLPVRLRGRPARRLESVYGVDPAITGSLRKNSTSRRPI